MKEDKPQTKMNDGRGGRETMRWDEVEGTRTNLGIWGFRASISKGRGDSLVLFERK